MSCEKPCLSRNVLWISTIFYFTLLEKRKEKNAKGKEKKKGSLKNAREHTAVPDSLSWTVFYFSQLVLFKQVSYLINTRALRYVFWIVFLALQSQWSEGFDISWTFFLLKIHCEYLSCSRKLASVATDFLVTRLNTGHIWTANKKLFIFKRRQLPHPAVAPLLPHRMIRGALN